MRAIEIVEIDVPRCQLVYSEAPCQAELGVTGDIKCFNTVRTCQDRENFDEGTLTLRFTTASSDRDEYDAIPSLQRISVTPFVTNPGESMGQRESVKIEFRDHLHSDVGIDKYVSERSYDPMSQGSFWGRFRARVPSLRGREIRVYRGEEGDSLNDMDTWHYVIESMSGPSGERFVIEAKDPLKFLDGDRAQAPKVTPGVLASDITDSDGALTLAPSGVGDEYYPDSGKAAIAGNEIVSFTRTGDSMSITRAQSGTEAESHDEEDGVQLVLEYESETAADIIYDLISTYTDMEDSWLPLSAWQEEISQFIGRLYSAEIAEPTAVNKLVNELISQVGLVMWSDVRNRQIELNALRPISSFAETYAEDRIREGSFRQKPQLDKRVSQVWTFIGLRNPLADMDDRSNYRSIVASFDDTGADAEYGGLPAIKKVYSRWIATNNRPAAERLNDLLLARYRDPPREISWAVHRTDTPPLLGRGAVVSHWELQDTTGLQGEVSTQIKSLEPTDDGFLVTSEELDFSGGIPDAGRVVYIDIDGFNIDLREVYDEIYSAPGQYDEITFVVREGVLIGTNVPGHAIFVGRWPEQPARITLINNGELIGRGGNGGDDNNEGGGDTTLGRNGAGGLAVTFVEGEEVDVYVENNGLIAGGGGGGGGAINGAGGGGMGHEPSLGGSGHPDPTGVGSGDTDGPGLGDNTGADGGQLGQDGGSAHNPGGQGGPAVSGDSHITWVVEGDIRGDRLG